MNILSRIKDTCIDSLNIFVETTIGEYLEIARQILKNNDLQRKKVRSSKSIYSLLKDDLKKGCVIPPLVLAITGDDIKPDISGEELSEYMKSNTNAILILDGLQRTYTMLAAEEDFDSEDVKLTLFLTQKIRLEIYIGINKFGILYRMLTLNTGQTPMTTRQQIEMLYGSIVDKDTSDTIKLVKETEGKTTRSTTEFKFNDAIEGFTSYIYRDELPIDRQDILEYIDMLSRLSNENTQSDLFTEFIETYSKVMNRLQELVGDEKITIEDIDDYSEYKLKNSVYGDSVVKIFNTQQAICGFGAAIGHLKDMDNKLSFNDITTYCEQINIESDIKHEWLFALLIKLDDLKITAKKIGNSQRMFFQFFFRQLFNNNSESYLNLEESVKNGYRNYKSQV